MVVFIKERCDYIKQRPRTEKITKYEKEQLLKMTDVYESFYIARNKNNSLRLFTTNEPVQTSSTWEKQEFSYFNDIDAGISLDANMFTFITWDSKCAWHNINLLKLEVID